MYTEKMCLSKSVIISEPNLHRNTQRQDNILALALLDSHLLTDSHTNRKEMCGGREGERKVLFESIPYPVSVPKKA